MSQTECEWFERKLAYNLSPSLLGIKCAGIVSIDCRRQTLTEQIERFNGFCKKRLMKLRVLCSCKKRSLIMLYRRDLLEKKLKSESKLLKKFGYPENVSAEKALDILSEKMRNKCDFPHEIGIFLDYPHEDVVGFISNKGRNYLDCGYWKVYGDVEKCRHIFSNYDKCRNFLCNKLDKGCDLYHALKIFQGGKI